MNVLSLFSGVGGADLGLERAGMEIIGQCEVNANARKRLERHWPGVPLSEDITQMDEDWLLSHGIATRNHPDKGQPVDLVVGGFPCQDLSIAGKRKGLEGARSGLFHEAIRIANLVLRPGGWLLIENVPGLLSSNGGRDLAIVFQTLARSGFWWSHRILDSRYFGVPQQRRRIFIVARYSREQGPREVLFESEGSGGNPTPRRQPRKDSGLPAGPGTPNGSQPEEPILTSTLTAHVSGGHHIDAEAAAGNQLIPDPPGWPQEIAPTLNAAYATKHGLENQHALSGAGLFVPETVDTLTTRISSDGVSEVDGELYVQTRPERVRRLTPTECERLQGFPDGWTIADPELAAGPDPNPPPDTPRYHQMGNAITVPVAEWIGQRILDQNRKGDQTK